MATPNPLENTHAGNAPLPVSSKSFHIAGIHTTVYGLDEVPSDCTTISCLWLLHPRLQVSSIMAPTASSSIQAWNSRAQSAGSSKKGLIAVSFDQRNHGTREVSKIGNEAWKGGNPRHAQDMFSIYHGTAMDTSLLIDHLGSYVFNEPGSPQITQHLTLGISLGGHAAWQVLFHEPRVTAAVVIIGCPDYRREYLHLLYVQYKPSLTCCLNYMRSFVASSHFKCLLVVVQVMLFYLMSSAVWTHHLPFRYPAVWLSCSEL